MDIIYFLLFVGFVFYISIVFASNGWGGPFHRK